MDGWSIGWSAVCALCAALGGSYWGARRAESGRIAAISLELDKVVKAEFEKSRAIEAGKRLATHEDIENVRVELEIVTKATEGIKARISDELWNKQKRHELKVSAYKDLLKGLTATNSAALRMFQWNGLKPEGDQRDWYTERQRLEAKLRATVDDMFQLGSFASVCVCPAAVEVLRKINTDHPSLITPLSLAKRCEAAAQEIASIAISDLGM